MREKKGDIVYIRTDQIKSQEHIPGKETKLWYKILFGDDDETKNIFMGWAYFEPGATCGMHFHDQDEAEFIVSGRGICEVDGQKLILEPGVAVYEPAGVPHNFTVTGDEPMIVLYVHPQKPKTKNLTFNVED